MAGMADGDRIECQVCFAEIRRKRYQTDRGKEVARVQAVAEAESREVQRVSTEAAAAPRGEGGPAGRAPQAEVRADARAVRRDDPPAGGPVLDLRHWAGGGPVARRRSRP